MKRRTVVAAIGGLMLSPLGPTTVRAAGERIRLAAPALDGTALMFYADEMGFFKNAGLDVEVQAMANGEAVTAGLTGGAIDIGCSQAVSIIIAFKRGLPVTIIAPGGMQTPAAGAGMFFVPKSSTAQSGRDFDNKTVAVVGIKGLAQFGTQAWLDKTGGNSASVKFLELSGAQIAVAIGDGKVDGAFVPEPFVSAVRKVARPITNPMEAISPTFVSSPHFAMQPWAKAHPEEIRRFQSAIHEAAVWANKNHDRTAQILVRVARVDPEIVRASTRTEYGERLDPAQLQPLINVTAKYGGLTAFPAADIIYAP
jgi:NitT/TauT family transport system substrate-binding protein